MRQLIYFHYVEEVIDWRVIALQELEYMIACKANRIRIPKHSPDDLAQEMRIHLWNNLNRFDKSKSSLKTWANRVLENKLKDIYKTECRTRKRKDFIAISLESLEI